MKLRVAIVSMLVGTIILAAGCMDREDRAWGERQKVLLGEMLDKPGVTYGGIIVDAKKREWTIRDLIIENRNAADKFTTTQHMASLTGSGAVLEPVSKPGLLVKKLTGRDIYSRVDYVPGSVPGELLEGFSFHVEEMVLDNLRGGRELQQAFFGFIQNGSMKVGLVKDMSYGPATIRGLTADRADPRGKDDCLLRIKNIRTEHTNEGVFAGISGDGCVVTLKDGDVASIAVAEFGAENFGSKKLLDLLIPFEGLDVTNLDQEKMTEYARHMASADYLLEGMFFNGVTVAYTDAPSLTVGAVTLDFRYDDGDVSNAFSIDALALTPEFLRSVASAPYINFPFSPLDVSFGLDFDFVSDEKTELLRITRLALAEKTKGGAEASFSISGGKGDFRQAAEHAMTSGLIVDSARLVMEDKGIGDFVASLVAVGSGQYGIDNAGTGGKFFRNLAALGIGMQCNMLSANMQTSCRKIQSFVNQGGKIEISADLRIPVSLFLLNMIAQLDEVQVATVYTPPAEL